MFIHFDQLAGTPHRLCRSAQSPLSSSNLCSSNLCSWATGDWSLPLIGVLHRRSSLCWVSPPFAGVLQFTISSTCRTLTLMYLIHHLSMIIRLSWSSLLSITHSFIPSNITEIPPVSIQLLLNFIWFYLGRSEQTRQTRLDISEG